MESKILGGNGGFVQYVMHIKTVLRAFKFTGERNILKIPSYFDFCIVYNFIRINVTCIC